MAKEIKEKREKKDKKEKKEKRAEADGVSKPKKEKKDKKNKDVTDALEAAIEEPEVSMMEVDSGAGADGEEPSGALVPFAFPLADNDKEVKKILKTVKKCTFTMSTSLRTCKSITPTDTLQLQRPRLFAVVLRKSSRLSASRKAPETMPISTTLPQSLSSPPTSRPWMSSPISPFSAKTTAFPTSTSSRAHSSARPAQLRGLHPSSWSQRPGQARRPRMSRRMTSRSSRRHTASCRSWSPRQQRQYASRRCDRSMIRVAFPVA